MDNVFTPQIITFSCRFSWGFGLAKEQLMSIGGRLIPTVCSGKIDATHLTEAFMAGADGVLVLGCLEGDCHYQDGNIEFKKRTALFRKILEALGIEGSRVRYVFGLDCEATSIPTLINKFSEDLIKMGPSPKLKPQAAARAWNV